MEKRYSLKAVTRRLGMEPNTLRSWELRYGAVRPLRTPTQRRVYTQEDVDRLTLICELLNAGHRISGVANLSITSLRSLAKPAKTGEVKRTDDSPSAEFVRSVVRALESFDFAAIGQSLEAARATHNTREFVLFVLSPLMARVGERVAASKLSVAHEHAVSAIVRDQIAQTLQWMRSLPPASKTERTFLFATPEGELHEFGILMSAALCSTYGFRGYYLGPNLPADALTIAIKALAPDYVVLGNARWDETRAQELVHFFRTLDKTLPAKTVLWLGGPADFPHLGAIFGKRRFEVVRTLFDFDRRLAGLQ